MKRKLLSALSAALLLCVGAITGHAATYPTDGTPTIQFYSFESYSDEMVSAGGANFQSQEIWQWWNADDYSSTPYYELYNYYGPATGTRYFTEEDFLDYWTDHTLSTCTVTYQTNYVTVYTNSLCAFTIGNTPTYRNFNTVTCNGACSGCQWYTFDEQGDTRVKVVGNAGSTYHLRVNVSANGSNNYCQTTSYTVSIPNGDIYVNGTLINSNGTFDLYVLGDGSWHDLTVRLATTNAYNDNFTYSISGATLLSN